MKNLLSVLFLFSLIIGFLACEPEEPVIPNEEELITTLTYTLTPVNGGASLTFQFRDTDGDGGNAPIISSDTLQANTTYTGIIQLLNEQNALDNITAEVAQEGTEHQFFYIPTLSDVLVSYDDVDTDGNPLGINTTLSTGAAGMGNITIILRHEPNKTATGVAAGDPTNAGGETDIEVTFDLDVQ